MAKTLITEAGVLTPTEGQARFKVRIIKAGWGSSGYYPAQVLESSGMQVFKAGTHMYLNHPTESDNWDIPERRVQDLAGVLATDAVYDAATESLEAEVVVFSDYAQVIKERAGDIGVSIRAFVLADEGEADGRYGDVITSFLSAESVDFVTRAGAGGAVLAAIESARSNRSGTSGPSRVNHKEESAMADTTLTPDQVNGLVSAMTTLADRLNQESKERKEAAEAASKPAEVDALAVAEAVTTSGIPTAMHASVFASVKAGTEVSAAIEAAKKTVQSIVSESGGSKAPLIVGAPKPVLNLEATESLLNDYLLGK